MVFDLRHDHVFAPLWVVSVFTRNTKDRKIVALCSTARKNNVLGARVNYFCDSGARIGERITRLARDRI